MLADVVAWIFTWPKGDGTNQAESLLLLFVGLFAATMCWIGSLVVGAVERRRVG
jgi:hypothetical protein